MNNTNLSQSLDTALARLQTGEALVAILADYPEQAQTLHPLLEAAAHLKALEPVEMPSAAQLNADRLAFLDNAALLIPSQPASPQPLGRLRQWIATRILSLNPVVVFQSREANRMSGLLVRTALILAVVFSFMGGAVALAAGSLPDTPLYPVKLAMEQVRLSMATNPAELAAQHLQLVQERVREMVQLAQAGKLPDETLMTRLENHLQQTLMQTAQTPEPEMLGLLAQTQQMAQTQTRALMRAQTGAGEAIQQQLQTAIHLMAQAQAGAEMGRQNPRVFRLQYGSNHPAVAPCAGDDCVPQGEENRHQNGPQPTQTPRSGQPAVTPCARDDCVPLGDENRHQNGPQPTQTPRAGQPAVTPCAGDDCVPQGEENRHQNGPQPTPTPRSGQPAVTPCAGDDCVPLGEGNRPQNDPQPTQTPNNGGGNNQGEGNIIPGNDNAGQDNSGSDSPGNDEAGNDNGNEGDSDSGNDNTGGDDTGNDSGGGDDSGGSDDSGGGDDSGGNDGGGNGGGNGGGGGK